MSLANFPPFGDLLGESATIDPVPRCRQTVTGPGPLAGHGLRFIPVGHAGNTNASAEEVECVAG